MDANDGFRELDRQECLHRLAKVPVGRIVYTRQALPAVLPVNFGLDHDGAVLVRVSAASELVRAIAGAVVAFEADEVDAAAHSGWSVVVMGAAVLVTDPAEHARLLRTGPRSWAAGAAGGLRAHRPGAGHRTRTRRRTHPVQSAPPVLNADHHAHCRTGRAARWSSCRTTHAAQDDGDGPWAVRRTPVIRSGLMRTA